MVHRSAASHSLAVAAVATLAAAMNMWLLVPAPSAGSTVWAFGLLGVQLVQPPIRSLSGIHVICSFSHARLTSVSLPCHCTHRLRRWWWMGRKRSCS